MALRALVPRQEGGGMPASPPRSPEYLVENIAPHLLAIECSLFGISTSAVLLRFYVRLFLLKTFGWDGKWSWYFDVWQYV